MSVGERIKALRKQRGMNQRELASRADLTQATISRIESGQVEQIRSDALLQLAEVLRVTMDYLAGRTEEIPTDELLGADPEAERLVGIYRNLEPESRMQLVRYAWFLQLAERMNLRQLGYLQELIGESEDTGGIDRQIAILRALANLSTGEE